MKERYYYNPMIETIESARKFTFQHLVMFALAFSVFQITSIVQSQNQPSGLERLETAKIIPREIWDRIFSQWSCNQTVCFEKTPETLQDSEAMKDDTATLQNFETRKTDTLGMIPSPRKRINHSNLTEKINPTSTDAISKQNNYGPVFLTVSFLLFVSILTISIARECCLVSSFVNSTGRQQRGRSNTRRRSNMRVANRTVRSTPPFHSIQIISNINGSVLTTENIGLHNEEMSLSYYYNEPRRMLSNSLHSSVVPHSILLLERNENRNRTCSAESPALVYPERNNGLHPSYYFADCPPTYQEISVHELPSYSEALTISLQEKCKNVKENSILNKSVT